MRGKERKGKKRKGKEGKERKGKEKKGKERKGKEGKEKECAVTATAIYLAVSSGKNIFVNFLLTAGK
jgi:hypothetical protein